MAKHFDKMPFLRFESSGSADQNRYSDIPLSEQLITTPHFHKYDSNGRFVAYKTDAIKELSPTDTDANECFTYFCNETNLRYKDDTYPSVKLGPEELIKFEEVEIDPNNNITFV